jgi:predicted secreted Zn-dependent protease
MTEEELDFPSLAMIPPPNIKDKVLQDAILEVRSIFDSYNSVRDEREALVAEAKGNDLEKILYAFGPLLTCFGLAIRITKVTGEIIIEKEAKKSTDEDKRMIPVEGTPREEIAAGGKSDDDQSKREG